MASIYQRGKLYWIKYYDNGKQIEYSLKTGSLQIAKEHKRRVESAQLRGDDVPRVTRTPTAEIVQCYAEHVRTVKTPKSAQTDIHYLRDTFGPICPALEVTSRRVTDKTRKKPARTDKPQQGKAAAALEGRFFEQITTAQITAFIDSQVRTRGLAPKTANRYREILARMFTWAADQGLIRLPNEQNPAATPPQAAPLPRARPRDFLPHPRPAPGSRRAARRPPLQAAAPPPEVSQGRHTH